MIRTMEQPWEKIAADQRGLVARRQLREYGVSRQRIHGQVRAGRWRHLSRNVVSTFTGNLDFTQRAWLGVLHAGGTAITGGLSSAQLFGLRRWEREEITVLVPAKATIEPLAGFRFVRTRRPLSKMRSKRFPLPTAAIEPAILLHAAYREPLRDALGLLAAAVQQRRTNPARLRWWLEQLNPLRGFADFQQALGQIEGGAQSAAEIDLAPMCKDFALPLPTRQRQRRDSRGRIRFTDAEWDLPDGHVLVLEVDGAFHMFVEHWEADISRQRALASPTRHVIRCTASELRTNPSAVAADIRRFFLGLSGL